MSVKCAIRFCKSTAGPENDFSFHRFPRKDQLKEQWCNALEIHFDVLKVKSKSFYVCSQHFKASDFGTSTLKNNSIPSQKLAYYSLLRKENPEFMLNRNINVYDFVEDSETINQQTEIPNPNENDLIPSSFIENSNFNMFADTLIRHYDTISDIAVPTEVDSFENLENFRLTEIGLQ